MKNTSRHNSNCGSNGGIQHLDEDTSLKVVYNKGVCYLASPRGLTTVTKSVNGIVIVGEFIKILEGNDARFYTLNLEYHTQTFPLQSKQELLKGGGIKVITDKKEYFFTKDKLEEVGMKTRN